MNLIALDALAVLKTNNKGIVKSFETCRDSRGICRNNVTVANFRWCVEGCAEDA